jgi:hypothetical protein
MSGQHDSEELPIIAWIGTGALSRQPIVVLDDEPRAEACDPWSPCCDHATARSAARCGVE